MRRPSSAGSLVLAVLGALACAVSGASADSLVQVVDDAPRAAAAAFPRPAAASTPVLRHLQDSNSSSSGSGGGGDSSSSSSDDILNDPQFLVGLGIGFGAMTLIIAAGCFAILFLRRRKAAAETALREQETERTRRTQSLDAGARGSPAPLASVQARKLHQAEGGRFAAMSSGSQRNILGADTAPAEIGRLLAGGGTTPATSATAADPAWQSNPLRSSPSRSGPGSPASGGGGGSGGSGGGGGVAPPHRRPNGGGSIRLEQRLSLIPGSEMGHTVTGSGPELTQRTPAILRPKSMRRSYHNLVRAKEPASPRGAGSGGGGGGGSGGGGGGGGGGGDRDFSGFFSDDTFEAANPMGPRGR